MGLLLPLLISAFAHGQTSCLPAYTALQTIESGDFRRTLRSKSSQGEFVTRVVFEGARVDGSLKMKAQFDPDFDGVSLPYNLYAVMVVANGEPIAWLDFTRGCTAPGLSFFPGRAIELPPVKLLGTPKQNLQIMVWGKL